MVFMFANSCWCASPRSRISEGERELVEGEIEGRVLGDSKIILMTSRSAKRNRQ